MGDKTKTATEKDFKKGGKYYRTPAQIKKDTASSAKANVIRKARQAELRDRYQNYRHDGSRDPVKSKYGTKEWEKSRTKKVNKENKMAGTKYTRKPVKKLTKSQAEMKKINKGIKKTIARNKKPVLGRALKNTAKGLGRGVRTVASMSPVGKGLKAAKVIKKAVKVVKKKRALKANPKYLKSDYAYKKKLQKRSSNAKTQKQQNKIEKELDLMNPNLTMDQRAKILGGY